MNNEFENNNFENEETKNSIKESEIEKDFPETEVVFEAEPCPVEEEHTSLEPEETVPEENFGPDEDIPHTEERVFFHEEVKPKKKRRHTIVVIIALVLAGCIFLGGVLFAMTMMGNGHRRMNIKLGTSEYNLTKSETVTPNSEIAKIAQLRMPSIVAITNRSVSDVITFFGTYSQESTSSGSGIIIGQNDTELLIVTNYHVIANAKELSVVFSAVESELEAQSEKGSSTVFDNERIPSAIVKGYDAAKDVAVIAVYLDEIPEDVLAKIEIAPIGDSSKMLPGDQVIAIGNSLGYGQSVTTGIISAVNRKITMQSAEGYGTVTNSFIQTDAAINQGNSGGALLDMAGNVIGINSVKIATTGVEGMGYAIPITDVEPIIENLMAQKSRTVVDEDKRGFLGIMGSDVQERESEMYGIPAGVYVSEVTAGLGAEKAGLKKGCVITGFDGYSITTMSQLQDRLRYYAVGEVVTITAKVPKDGKYEEKEFKVTLSSRAENEKK